MKGGKLKTTPLYAELGLKDLLPMKTGNPDIGCERTGRPRDLFCFDAGDRRVNEQVPLTIVHTLMMREHNRIADQLAYFNSYLDDETLYQETRRIMIAQIQHITYNEFLPVVLGEKVMEKYGLNLKKTGYYNGYNSKINAGTRVAFQAGAYRFGHSMIPDVVERYNKFHDKLGKTFQKIKNRLKLKFFFTETIRMSKLFLQPFIMYKPGIIDSFILGLLNQESNRMDPQISSEVTNHLFEKPGQNFGQDLTSIDIQRGREFGIPGYNYFREYCGLKKAYTFDDLIGDFDNQTLHRFTLLFKNVDDIDLLTGGMSEFPAFGSMIGPTFTCIVAEQFVIARDSDRFWYENEEAKFNSHQLAEIRKTTLAKLICENSDDIDTVQLYPFLQPDPVVEMQTLTSNEITLFMDELHSKILDFIKLNDQDKKGLILAIIILVSVDIGNTKQRCSRFANLLRSLDIADVESMELAAYAIGRIALASGPITDSYVNYEATRALEFISENNSDLKKQLGRVFAINFNQEFKSNDYVKEIFIDLLNDTPSTALKAFLTISRSYDQLPKDVFNAAFYSCWTESKESQAKIINDLEQILMSDTVPEVITVILNLVEFMHHTSCDFPVNLNLLSEVAIKYRAYAKALRFKENEFLLKPSYKALESLIMINNKLRQSESVTGIIKYAAKHHGIDFKVKEQWYEKLHDWENALRAYQQKREINPNDVQSIVGQMRCLEMLGEWEELYKLSSDNWLKVGSEYQSKIARMCAAAAWSLGKWDDMEIYSDQIRRNTSDYPFYKAILSLHKNEFLTAQNLIDVARDKIDPHLTAMVGESQDRAYGAMVSLMLFSELEEAIQYKLEPEKGYFIKKKWWDRLRGCQQLVEDWQKVLKVHSLVLTPYQDRKSWLKFSSICQKVGRVKLSQKVLYSLIKEDNEFLDMEKYNLLPKDDPSRVFFESFWKKANVGTGLKVKINCPLITYGFIKHLWRGDDKKHAFEEMKQFNEMLHKWCQDFTSSDASIYEDYKISKDELLRLTSKSFYKLGHWQEYLNETSGELKDYSMVNYFKLATKWSPDWYKAWNSFALSNYKAISVNSNRHQFNSTSESDTSGSLYVNLKSSKIVEYSVSGIKGFFKSISLSHGSSLQNTLRLLTILFEKGHEKEVANAFNDCLKSVPIETWLQVIPQLIARIDIPKLFVCKIIQQLLIDVSKCHPQAIIYSLTVAQKSSVKSRNQAANNILKTMSEHSSLLVSQALLVSDELIRVSILWHELWHEGLEEASRLYFGDKNVQAMLEMLKPLHKHLERGPTTLKEMSFKNAFGTDLMLAQTYCIKYRMSGDVKHVTQAWEYYYHVFKKISKQLPKLTSLELQYVSPKLLKCCDLELAVPGIYHPNKPIVKISRINSDLQVIASKQKPRKLCIRGSNGKDFLFLLKGHEDLRQDERVMQLFGLVNTLLACSFQTRRRNLAIQRYSVIPLSHNSGLIGWVPHCDTLHTLIKDYRDRKKTLLNIEHRIMLRKAPNFDRLTIMQKVEIFEHVLDSTNGDDIHCLLWNKSPNSEIWFERRTNYTRSLAVMSMVGYILGLGDRHPSNLMIDRLTGKVLHIDFGDCFEVAMVREKFPEKIPFRLTRMLIKAMEVTGIEGTYKITCEQVLKVLRHDKDSLVAVLEAFIYDPLLNWGLTETSSIGSYKNYSPESMNITEDQINDLVNAGANNLGNLYLDGKTKTEKLPMNNNLLSDTSFTDLQLNIDSKNFYQERLNKKALAVINRILAKLTGRDFDPNVCLDVSRQVELLVKQATSNENLCQLYIGWCPFW
ncbi:hypothetical protein RND71_043564 [Anisodus tanguticus]|uniref:non-specific serine/threonine protein kinase n=1 Tax=Anisodus tanguticus TaxID=243964 RepID=A0AAE1QNM3_9SOLA|nr:hypothetical protein RND71_043564 [Anisodus tanguticus]